MEPVRGGEPIFQRLVLHVGSHKTGTSAIQRAANLCRGALLDQGVLYPESGQWHDSSHHQWSFALWDREDGAARVDALCAQLEAECEALSTPVETGVLSSELLEKILIRGPESFVNQTLSRLASSVTVVLFLRRQDLLVESVFKQWVKDPATRLRTDVQTFLKEQIPNLDFNAIASSWRSLSIVDDVIVRTNALESHPVETFFGALGWSHVLDDFSEGEKIINASLDGRKLEFKFFANALALTNDEDKNLLTQLARVKAPKERLSIFSDADRTAFIKRFDACNEALYRAFSCEAFNDHMPSHDRLFRTLSGQELSAVLRDLEQVDKALHDTLFSKIAQHLKAA
ncbi:MAG: hypothetical protein ACFB6R_18555 [Alphaproteobacteria bacterium]